MKLPGYYKEGMHLTLQKFQKSDKAIQMLLGECDDADRKGTLHEIRVFGLDFSAVQHRAVTALNFLLDRTNFRGNAPAPKPEESERVYRQYRERREFRFTGSLPSLQFPYNQYFEAYGLDRKGDRTFNSKEAQNALGALKSLSEPWSVAYAKRNGKKTAIVSRSTTLLSPHAHSSESQSSTRMYRRPR
jgi:hypothetical protein